MDKDRATLTRFCRQFACMLDAGLPLVQCLGICIQHESDADFARVLRSVKRQVEEGGTFSDALREHPKFFDQYYVWMVAAGEGGGMLDTIMNRLANHLEQEADIEERVAHAFGDSLPNILALAESIEVARCTRSLGHLLASGVPMSDALEIAAADVNNPALKSAIMKTRDALGNGKRIASTLAEYRVLPPMVTQMIGVSEDTDHLDAMLIKIAEFYEDEVRRGLDAIARRRS